MIDSTLISVEDLPPVAQELAHVVGLKTTIEFVELYGGRVVYFPKEFSTEHPVLSVLVAKLGHDTAYLIWEVFQNDMPPIPRCTAALKAVRNEQIRAKRQAGKPVAELVVEFNLTSRRIHQIAGKALADENQLGLF